MIPYSNTVGETFGLRNIGSNCYLNSLVQVLLSIPAFCETVIKKKNKSRLYSLLYLLIIGKEKDTRGILQELINLQKNNRAYQLKFNSQEDAFEGFKLIINELKLESLFNIRHKQRIFCSVCKHQIIVPAKTCAPEIFMNMNVNTNVQEYIKENYNFPDGYKCENCESRNDNSPVIMQRYNLAMLSSVIVLSFSKTLISPEFPNKLFFKSTDNKNLVYKLIAVIQHFGTQHGGHYTATAIRGELYNFNDSRVSRVPEFPKANVYLAFYHLL